MTRQRYAVIVTHDREEDYGDCMYAIAPQVGKVVTVSHRAGYVHQSPFVVVYDEEVPNISRMWNLGLDRVAELAGTQPYDVAVLNDDAIVPPDWFERVATGMHRYGRGRPAGCVQRPHDPRMAGYAFVLNGDVGLRADEQFVWWYGDDDLQRRAEQAGGVAFVRGPDVEHRYPNSTTVGELADIAARDKIRFERKWK